jgi:hypothetical protein
VKKVIIRNVLKLVNTVFSIQEGTEEEISTRFTKRFKHIYRWFIGELIDVLKVNLEGGIPDGLKTVVKILKGKLNFNLLGFDMEGKLQ